MREMQALVETLLRRARLENRQEVVLTAVDVAALFRRVSEAHRAVGRKTSLYMLRPPRLMLLLNRRYWIRRWGIYWITPSILPRGGRITLSAEVDQEHVTLKVLDTGSGIPDYALSRIFERFYSLPRANGQKAAVAGLAFVSEVARLFNGEVTLRNDAGRWRAGLASTSPSLHIASNSSHIAFVSCCHCKGKTMLKSLFWKMTTLFGAVLLLLIPIMLIRRVIVDVPITVAMWKMRFAKVPAGRKRLVGPLIAIPVTEALYGAGRGIKPWSETKFIQFWLPESLMVDGEIRTWKERKDRDLYRSGLAQ